MWPETAKEVELEISLLRRLIASHQALLDKVCSSEPDNTELLAISALLHSFYTGVENVFKRIALEIDGSLPTGHRWHADLLLQMERPTDRRQAVISQALRTQLGEYMDFRHMFRHAYSFQLKWRRMSGLVRRCRQTLDELETEVRAFLATD